MSYYPSPYYRPSPYTDRYESEPLYPPKNYSSYSRYPYDRYDTPYSYRQGGGRKKTSTKNKKIKKKD